MSSVENVNLCYICDLAFEIRKQFVKHNLSDEHLNKARKEYEDEVEDPQSGVTDETKERVYNSDEDYYVLRAKDLRSSFANNTKDVIKTKTETETKSKTKTDTDDNISPRIKYECKECHEEFRNKIALTTHSNSHNRMYLENTEDFDINSSQNMREFYITDKGGNYIEDLDEATNYSLEEIKTVTSIEKLRVLNIRSRPSVSTRKEPKKKLKLLKYFSTLTILLKTQYMKM